MFPKKNSGAKSASGISVHGTGRYSFFVRPLVLGIITFCLLASLFGLLIYQRYALLKEAKIKEAYEIVNAAKDKLQETLAHSLSATKTLAFFIAKDGEVDDFNSIAAQILETSNDIDAVQLVPDGIIKYVYPVKGNERIIGYNILQDTARNKEAYKAIVRKEMFFAGPFELRQGGVGVVGRLPVYRNNKFWGFSAVVIKMATLFRTAGIDSTGNSGFYFQLSKLNPDTKKEEYFLPVHGKEKQSHSVSVNVPNGEWKLSVIRVKEYSGFGDIALLALLGFLLSVSVAVFGYRIAGRPRMLNRLVKEQTQHLKQSENKYRSVIERVSDAFVSIDKDWNYTYINAKAGELLGNNPEFLAGKNIWAVYPEAVNQPFYHAYYRAMETQKYQYLEEFFHLSNKWFESHIYPSKDGLTIFFKDVTAIKEITQELKEKEEKYRSLIEQASDGIVITDLEGNILEVNNSIIKMVGFDAEDMIGHHLADYMPEEDIELIPLSINELMQGKSLLYERRLQKRDGTLLAVEVNSKMASTHTLIGFIRDITERKKAEKAVQKSNERFELIAEATNDAVWDHDFEKNETWGNSKLYKLYGIEKGTQKITLEMFMDRIHADERTGVIERMQLAISNTVISLSEVFRFRTGPGTYRIFNDRAYIKYDDAGKPLRIMGAMLDITDTEEAKKTILESEEKFRAIIEQASDGIFIADENTFFIDVNTAGCRMTGFTLAELQTKRFMDIIPPEDLENIPVKITSMENGASVINERRMLRKDGTTIDVEISAKKLLDGRYQSIARDITERKKYYKALMESEERYRVLVENATEALVVLDFESNKFVSVSDSASRLFGISKEELLNLGPVELSPQYQPDGRLSADAAKDYIIKAVNGEKSSFEWVHKTFSGELIQCELWLVRLPSDTKTLIRGTIVNITERKKAEEALQLSEQKYRLLFYNNPLPMWMTTLPGLDIIDVNDAAIRQYGYSREEFLKLNTRQLRPAEDVEIFLGEVDKMQPGISNVRNWRHKKKDGSVIEVETYSHQIMYEGQPAWLGLSHDVTEKNEAKELLQKSYQDIRELASNLQTIREDERTSIAREIHDELGQQLTGLKMDLHWLTKKINSTDPDISSKMEESIALINATIASVRKISTDLRPSILDDLGLVAALEWQSEEFEKRSGSQVKFINNAGDITVVPEISTAIFRIYQELLTNIARHANADTVMAFLQKENNKLNLRITDNGSGFNLETIGNKKTLGLLGIKERTLILGGTYEIKSEPGKGSETIISIPLADK